MRFYLVNLITKSAEKQNFEKIKNAIERFLKLNIYGFW
jgi:hypothetical protein